MCPTGGRSWRLWQAHPYTNWREAGGVSGLAGGLVIPVKMRVHDMQGRSRLRCFDTGLNRRLRLTGQNAYKASRPLVFGAA